MLEAGCSDLIGSVRRGALGIAIAIVAVSTPPMIAQAPVRKVRLVACRRSPGQRRRVHRQDQGVPLRPADLDRTGRPSPGLRHRADAAQVPRPHRRHPGRADACRRHPRLHARHRQGFAARQGLEHGDDRGRARDDRHGDRRREDDRDARQVQGVPARADRSAEDHRKPARSRSSTPPSRSTGSPAACTPRNRAVPRC